MSTSLVRNFIASSIGKKYLMALTGLIWAGFVMAHMLGNLLIFVSADAYNSYGHFLTSGKLIYVAEALLVAALVVHVFCAVALTIQNRRARGEADYSTLAQGAKRASWGSRNMAAQGSLILSFIILHLITFKFGEIYLTNVGGVEMRDLHRLVVEVFSSPGYVAWYVFCLGLLYFHLRHGVQSIFQSLGLLNERLAGVASQVGWVYAVVVSAGFLSQPVYVFFFS